eukprot:SAG11_NODE_2756_length_3006_cov_8.607155_3_plen_86_part_00
MCTLVHLKKYSFVFVEKYIKSSTSNRSYEKECFNCNVYFDSNEATQVIYVQPSQDLSYILTSGVTIIVWSLKTWKRSLGHDSSVS